MKSDRGANSAFLLKFPILLVLSFLACKKQIENSGTINMNERFNQSPVARAGADQTVTLPCDSVLLDGSSSNDPDGIIKNFFWRVLSGPVSSMFSSNSSVSTMIRNLTAGIYQIELLVKDNQGKEDQDTVQITVIDPRFNHAPIANAGPDQTIVFPQQNITVDGSGSTDPDNNISTYQWRQVSNFNSTVIANQFSPITTVAMPTVGSYSFELLVIDASGLFSKDTMEVQVLTNVPPPPCDNIQRPIINASLSILGNLSHARSGMTTAAAGTKIVFAGASLSDSGSPLYNSYGSSRVDIYDWSTDTWSTAELSEWRSDIAAVSSGNKIFFAGGRLGDGAFDMLYSTVDIYDVSTNSWTVANLSQPRAYIAAAAVGNKVLFAGGEKDWNYNNSTVVDIYDISTNSWTTANLSEPRAFISAVTLNNKVYFAGGSIHNRWYNNPSSRIDIFDNATGLWTTSSLPVPMLSPTGIATTNNIFWTDGCRVDVMNTITSEFTTMNLFSSTSWMEVQGHKALMINNKLVFLRADGDGGWRKFDIYDIVSNTWSIGELPQPLYGPSYMAANNTIYLAGGNQGNGGFTLTKKIWLIEF